MGVTEIWARQEVLEIPYDLVCYFGRVLGTCALLYIFFLCRVLGAGDIKLMAVSIGFLGIERGMQMIVCGLLLAFIVESLRTDRWKCGYLGLKGVKVKLAPYLFFGYCLFALFFDGRG